MIDIAIFLAVPAAALGMLGACASLVGMQLNLRRREMFADGLVHAIFPAIVIGFAFAGVNGTYIGAAIGAVFATIALTLIELSSIRPGAGLAVIFTGLFGLGVVLVSGIRGFTGGLEHVLVGHVLTATTNDLAIVTALGVLTLILLGCTWRAQTLLSFDADGARAAGHRVIALDLILNIAIALIVVAGVRIVGNLLVVALLLVPPAIGRLVSRDSRGATVAAVLAGGLLPVAGLGLATIASFEWNLHVSPAASCVLVLLIGYLVAVCGRAIADGGTRSRPRTARAKRAREEQHA